MNVGNLMLILNLIQAILSTVHSVEAALPGAPGADKSQRVIDTVKPIADTLGAHSGQIQSVIDTAVALFKWTGVFSSTPKAPDAAALVDPSQSSQTIA